MMTNKSTTNYKNLVKSLQLTTRTYYKTYNKLLEPSVHVQNRTRDKAQEARQDETRRDRTGALTEVQAHEEVREGEIGDQEPRDIHLGPGKYQHHHHCSIPEQRQQEHDPHAAAQRPPVKEILARHEGACGDTDVITRMLNNVCSL